MVTSGRLRSDAIRAPESVSWESEPGAAAAAWRALGEVLLAETDPTRFCDAVCRCLVHRFGFSRALVATVDPQRNELVGRAGYDPSAPALVQALLLKLIRAPLEPDPDGRYITAVWAVLNDEEVHIPDAERYAFRPDRTYQRPLLAKALDLREYLLVPFHPTEDVRGVIGVDKLGQESAIGSEDRERVRAVASLVGSALARDAGAEAPDSGDEYRRFVSERPDRARPHARGNAHLVLESLPSGLLLLDPDGRIRYINRTGASMLEVFPGDVIGAPLNEVITVERPLEFERLLAERPSELPPRLRRWRIQSTSGAALDVEVHPFTLLDENAAPAAAVLFDDIGETVRAETMRDDFVSMLVHDLKAPSQNIAGFAELLLLERFGELNETQRDIVTRIERSAIHQLELIADVLKAAYLQPGQSLMEKEPLGLRPVIQEVLEGLQASAIQRSIRLRNDVPEDLPPIYGDRLRLKELFQNLIDNAINASQPGNAVRIRVEPETGGDDRDRLCCAIEDHGEGLDEESAAHLFERFWHGQRLGERRRRRGMGLIIARLIVEAHRGEIWAEYDPEAGTTVRLTLPIFRPVK